MSFEKMQNHEAEVLHERSCMMLYGFTPAELKQIQNIARLVGLRDQILLKAEHGNTKIEAILNNELEEGCEEMAKDKAIIFNNIPATRMNAFIEALKKYRMNRPLIAVVTKHSINWNLKELVGHLIEERTSLNSNKGTAH